MKSVLQKHTYLILLIIALFTSAIIKFQQIDTHFQETDSYVTYHTLQHFETTSFDFYNNSYPDTNAVIQQLRRPIINKIISLKLPFAIQSFFALPLSSTYSPIPGLLYGTLMNKKTQWHQFKTRATLFNIGMFSFSILLLFFSLVKITHSKLGALTTCILLTFAYSWYHYSFHFGSTIFSLVAMCGFLYAIAFFRNNLTKFYIIGSLLLFTNYLVFIYIVPFILFDCAYLIFKKKYTLSNLLGIGIFLFAAAICIAIFYPPNTGYKGSFTNFAQIPKHSFYIFLNAFSFSNNLVLASLQCILLLFIFALGLYKMKTNIALKLFFSSLLLFIILFAFKKLDFSPDRQQLHLFIFISIILAFGFNFLEQAKHQFLKVLLPISLIIYGAFANIKSHKYTNEFSTNNAILQQSTLVHSSEFYLFNNATIGVIDKKNDFQNDSVYHFISRRSNQLENTSISQKIEIVSKSEQGTDDFFTAFNPFKSTFSDANKIYTTAFKLKK